MQDLIRKIDLGGIRGFRVYAESGDEYVWTGRNHTVNVYDASGTEYDVMSVGDFAQDAATWEEVLDAIVQREADLAKFEDPEHR